MAESSRWTKLAPWYITIVSTFALVLVSYYLYVNIEWFKKSAIEDKELMKDPNYLIFIYSSHLSMLKRSLGIITGIAITFIGLAVSFHALEKSAEVNLSGFAKLTTFSPGLFAILFGCYLISQSIDSKDSIEFAKPQTESAHNTQTSEAAK